MADAKDVTDDKKEEDEEEVVEEAEKTTDKETEEKEEETEEEEEAEEEEKEPEDVEPPVRNATLQHIIARKNKKIEKLEKKGEEEEEEEETTPTDTQRIVDEAIDSRMKPIEDSAAAREADALLSDLYSKEPEAKPYDKIIRKFINFEKDGVKPYELIPPEIIYHHLSHGQAESAGAKKEKVAETEAKLSKTRGGGKRSKDKKTDSGLPSVSEMEGMDDAEFNKEVINPALQK